MLLDAPEARRMKISASARPPSGANERKASRLEWVMLSAQQLATHRLSITASSRRSAQDDGRGCPLQKPCVLHCGDDQRSARLARPIPGTGEMILETSARATHRVQRVTPAILGHFRGCARLPVPLYVFNWALPGATLQRCPERGVRPL